jgi:hypothetical protein
MSAPEGKGLRRTPAIGVPFLCAAMRHWQRPRLLQRRGTASKMCDQCNFYMTAGYGPRVSPLRRCYRVVPVAKLCVATWARRLPPARAPACRERPTNQGERHGPSATQSSSRQSSRAAAPSARRGYAERAFDPSPEWSGHGRARPGVADGASPARTEFPAAGLRQAIPGCRRTGTRSVRRGGNPARAHGGKARASMHARSVVR